MVQGVRLVTSAFYGQGFPEGQELGGEGGETLRFFSHHESEKKSLSKTHFSLCPIPCCVSPWPRAHRQPLFWHIAGFPQCQVVAAATCAGACPACSSCFQNHRPGLLSLVFISNMAYLPT
jgi:hypothetical protein